MLGCAPSFADIWSCSPGLCKSIHAWLSTLYIQLSWSLTRNVWLDCTTTILHWLQALVLVIVTVAQRMLKSVTCCGHSKSSEQWSLQVVIELNHSSCTCALPLAVFFVKMYARNLDCDGAEKKRTLRFSQTWNLDLLNCGQMFSPTEPLDLWLWSRW